MSTRRRAATAAIIGYGAIGRVLAAEIAHDPHAPRLVGALVRSRPDETRAALGPSVAVVSDVEALVSLRPDIVVECAGQEALRAHAGRLLDAGIDVMAIATGALASPGVLEDWTARARRSGARLIAPAGAIAGLDGLGAHKRAGLERVVYTSTKPPLAWRGTPAEERVDLAGLREPVVFFDASAREAALAYPKNANLAATVALAGLGLDETRVRLVADPAATGNTGRIEATSAVGTLLVENAGAAGANPKTSASTAYSLAYALATESAHFVI